jgi:hypothetical protein
MRCSSLQPRPHLRRPSSLLFMVPSAAPNQGVGAALLDEVEHSGAGLLRHSVAPPLPSLYHNPSIPTDVSRNK